MAKGGSPRSRARHERWLWAYIEGATFQQIADGDGVKMQSVHGAVRRELQRRGLRLERRRMVVPVASAALADELRLSA